MSFNIIINGANGRMGQEAVKAVTDAPEFNLVAQATRADDLATLIQTHRPDVVVDLTTADSVYANTKIIIDNDCHPVIGASGLLPDQVRELQTICHEKKLGGIIVPNFSIGAVLMMQMAEKAAHYLPNVEIIEAHHEKKQDAPSGTAIKTAELINQARQQAPLPITETELLKGARGAKVGDVPIHSVRLPGVVAKQDVIFGGTSETLTISHNSIHRESFMPGLLLACKRAPELKELYYGLEALL